MKKPLLIGALGAPLSGKTTTIALLFGEMKKRGYSVEYLPEYARTKIREMKAEGIIDSFGEEHQKIIRKKQEELETLYINNNGKNSITLVDGSTATSFFYKGSDDFSLEVNRYDVLFFCRNLNSINVEDPNRIHDKKFSLKTDLYMSKKINNLPDLLSKKIIYLDGNIEERLGKALNHIISIIESKNAAS